MNPFFLIPFFAGAYSLLLAALSLFHRNPSPAARCFSVGMTALGLDSIFTGLSLRATQLGDVVEWLWPAFVVKSFLPVILLGFSLTYSRRNYREFLARWAGALVLLSILPIGVSLGYLAQLGSVPAQDGLWWMQSGVMAKGFNLVLIVSLLLILMNLEQTFRSAVGTMRWRIKFVILALGLIFGARLYVQSQAVLFSAPDIAMWGIESVALLIGCGLLSTAYARTQWAESDLYPSLAIVRSSLTVLIVGGYLLVIGLMAQLVSRFGGAEIFQFQAAVVLLGMAGLALLLFSDRARQRVNVFVLRHFRKAQHDSVRIWTLFSRRLSSVTDQAGLCTASAALIAETFDVLSVAIWLVQEDIGRLTLAASTAPLAPVAGDAGPTDATPSAVFAGLDVRVSPFDLEDVNEAWAEELRQLNTKRFANGGNRMCVPLRAGDRALGAIVLADRINGAVYSVEELELLKCIGDQITSVLLNVRLANEVAHARELEAFRTMSAFFVHDLKNAAASLNLMLKNLPVHFDDPEFREDALRGIGNTARRIDDMIGRLSALRQKPALALVESDLNELVNAALERVNGMTAVELTTDLHPLPRILADREQINSVVTNLVLNARDALGVGGRIHVATERRGERVVLSVADNGCGMSSDFVKDSLFRPFQSTKKKGLGIGLFQCRAIVQAHGGGIEVESKVGSGTRFMVRFPITHE